MFISRPCFRLQEKICRVIYKYSKAVQNHKNPLFCGFSLTGNLTIHLVLKYKESDTFKTFFEQLPVAANTNFVCQVLYREVMVKFHQCQFICLKGISIILPLHWYSSQWSWTVSFSQCSPFFPFWLTFITVVLQNPCRTPIMFEMIPVCDPLDVVSWAKAWPFVTLRQAGALDTWRVGDIQETWGGKSRSFSTAGMGTHIRKSRDVQQEYTSENIYSWDGCR